MSRLFINVSNRYPELVKYIVDHGGYLISNNTTWLCNCSLSVEQINAKFNLPQGCGIIITHVCIPVQKTVHVINKAVFHSLFNIEEFSKMHTMYEDSLNYYTPATFMFNSHVSAITSVIVDPGNLVEYRRSSNEDLKTRTMDKHILSELKEQLNEVDKKLDQLDERVEDLDEKVDKFHSKFVVNDDGY